MSYLINALDAVASNPVSGSWSSIIATTEEECSAKSASSAALPPSPVTPSCVDPGSVVANSFSDEGVAMMRLISLKAFNRSRTFRIPKAIVSCEDGTHKNVLRVSYVCRALKATDAYIVRGAWERERNATHCKR